MRKKGIRSVTYRILLKIPSASRFFTIDVSPSFALDERKLIGGYADNLPVFAVNFFNSVNKITFPKAKRKWNVCCRPGFGTWKDGKWMDVDIVDDITQKVLKGNQHILFNRNWTCLKPEKPKPEANTEHEGYGAGVDAPEMTSLLRPLSDDP